MWFNCAMDNLEQALKEKMRHGFSLEKLAGDASGKEYSRMKFDNSGDTAIMLNTHAPFDAEHDDWLYMRSYLKECGITVPEVHLMEPSHGLLYLEDCGDDLMQYHASGAEKGELTAMYKKALDILILMQTEGTRRLNAHNPAQKRKFDADKYTQELNHAAEWYILGYLSKKLTPNNQDKLNNFFHRLIAPILEIPMVFTHRDYHSRNIMIKGDKFYVIDFQDARLGPPHYDVASLLFDSYINLGNDVRNELAAYYKEKAEKTSLAGPITSRFESNLRRMALQRNIKALGTFGFQSVSRKNALYEQFMPDTVRYVAKNIHLFEDLKEDADWVLSLLQ